MHHYWFVMKKKHVFPTPYVLSARHPTPAFLYWIYGDEICWYRGIIFSLGNYFRFRIFRVSFLQSTKVGCITTEFCNGYNSNIMKYKSGGTLHKEMMICHFKLFLYGLWIFTAYLELQLLAYLSIGLFTCRDLSLLRPSTNYKKWFIDLQYTHTQFA